MKYVSGAVCRMFACRNLATFACADCADRDSDIPVVAAASVTTCVTSSVTRPSMVTCHVSRVTCAVSRVPCHVSRVTCP